MTIDAQGLHFQPLNEAVRSAGSSPVVIEQCVGQRYIGSGLSEKTIEINGTPGNALGAYLDGAEIVVHGNAQDATGDTMNVTLWVVVAIASCAAIPAVVVVCRRRTSR